MVDDGRYGDEAYDPAADGEDEEEWFGEGSAFDSGEDLAAALFSMAGVSMPGGAEAEPMEEVHEPLYETAGPSAPPRPPAPAAGVSIGGETFQVLERPAAPAPGPSAATPGQTGTWSVRPQVPGTARTSWGMRHSVQFLKMTEEVMKKLRNEAIELTWQVAAVAVEQGNAAKRR